MNEWVADSGKVFELFPEGTHDAILVGLVNMGTVTESFNGQEKKLKKIALLFEFPTILNEEGKPKTICSDYTFSMASQSKLRELIKKWRDKPLSDEEAKTYDISRILGQRCTVHIEHIFKKDGITKIAIIEKLKKAGPTNTVKGTIEPFLLSFKEFDHNKLQYLPPYIVKKIESTPEYNELIDSAMDSTPPSTHPDEENLPF